MKAKAFRMKSIASKKVNSLKLLCKFSEITFKEMRFHTEYAFIIK